MKVKSLLTEDAAQTLSEESIQVIEQAFREKLDLTVEAALAKQDDLYASKLETLIKALDKDHTIKLTRVVEAIDRNNFGKLNKVVKRYERVLNQEASKFKSTLVESISNYLEEFIDEAVPTQAIMEATKNKTAIKVLDNLRKVLAVDSALMSESVQSAVVDGKQQLDTLSEKVTKLEKENALLKEHYTKTKSALILEEKVAGLSDKQKEYVKRVLGDKTPKFIEENFDYTLRLFKKQEGEHLKVIKEQAFETRKVKADRPVITESARSTSKETTFNPYVEELERLNRYK
jgi:cell division protein FtsB